MGYFGRAWVVYRFDEGGCEIFCDDPDVAYEVCYLAVLSYVGERLDRRRLHRVHGLGLSVGGNGVLVMAPSGGGKSTIAMQLLGDPEVRLLSDDTPLVAPGRIMAFPQRIGLREPPDIPSRFVRRFRRARYAEKFVVGSEYFGGSVVAEAPLRAIVLLEQNRGDTASVRPCSRLRLIWPLMKWLVAGYETPQIWELFLRGSPRDLVAKTVILWHRLRSAMRLLLTCDVARMYPSTNPHECGRALVDYGRFRYAT